MRRTEGFTLVELLVVIVIAAVLLTTSVRTFGEIFSSRSVVAARSTFGTLHAKARAIAIERGTDVEFMVSEAGDSIFLVVDGTTEETFNFQEALGVDVTRYKATGDFKLCMTPRGYADTGCNNFTSWEAFFFNQGPDSVWTVVLPLGQLTYPERVY
jgi:prepilin-type N-terminal cleavage/methylation domain-containing protein